MQKFILIHKVILFSCFSLLTTEAYGQLGFCQGNSGDPIFTEDFGVGTTNTVLPSPGTTTYTFSNGIPDDGFYTVTNGTFGNGFDWHQTEDHTPGDINGKCLIIQAGPSAGEFYRTDVSGLCENTTYEFSAWIINLVIANSFCSTEPGGTIPINVRFEIWDDTDTNLLASGDTGNIVETSSPNWQENALVFQTLPAQTSVILKMINNGAGGCGNDLAIDDIVFKSCGDLIAVEDGTANNSISICNAQIPYDDTLTAIPDFTVFNDHFYQWQESPDGNTWTDIVGETNASLAVTGLTTTTYYRAKVAEFAANLNNVDCLTFSDIYQIIVNPSPIAPVSNGDVDFNCNTNQVVLSVAPVSGISVNWFDAASGGILLQSDSETYTATTSGTYYAEAVDGTNGCVSVGRTEVSATIVLPDAPSSDGDVSLDCETNEAILTVSVPTGISVDWFDAPSNGNLLEPNSTSLVVNSQGTYYAEAKDVITNCVSATRVAVNANVTVLDDPSFTISPTCDGAVTTITGIVGGTFAFNPVPNDGAIIDASTGTVTNGTPGESYTIEYTTLSACSAASSQTFSVLPAGDASFVLNPTCDGGVAIVTGLEGGVFSFNPMPIDGALIDSVTGSITAGVPNTTYIVEYTTSGPCSSTNTESVTVLPKVMLVDPTTLEVCDDSTRDGLTEMDLSLKNGEITGGNPGYTVSYYENQADADSQSNPLPTLYTNTSNPQILYVSVEDTVTGCQDTTTLELIVQQGPIAFTPQPLRSCDGDNDGFGAFTLTDAQNAITGGASGLRLTYHETMVNAINSVDAIDTSVTYNTIVMNSQTLYVRVESDAIATDCATLIEIQLIVDPTPTPSEQLPDIELCDESNAGDGEEIFDLTANEILILNGLSGVTASYYESAQDANTGQNAIVDPTQYTNTQSTNQEIYVRVTNDLTGCYALVNFRLIVHPLPEVVAVTDFIQCELNTDGNDSFDLNTKDEEVLNGQDPSQFMVSYHASLSDSGSGQNALVSPYINTVNPQRIFVRITNNATGCAISTQSFNIEVQQAAQANPDGNLIVNEQCDDAMETDGDPSNDSVQFDLGTQDPEVLDGQDPANYLVRYFATEADANLNVNPLPTLYENIVNPQVIYARVDDDTPDGTGIDSSICYAVAPLTLQVNPLPEFNLEDNYTLCINTNGTESLDPLVIDTGLSPQNYSFQWVYNTEVLPGEIGSSIIPTQGGSYSVTVTDLNTSAATNCTNTDTTEVIESEPPVLELNLVTQAFADNHVIEAIATAVGDSVTEYEYSLDGGPWQDSGIFSNVSSGTHEVTARDKNGCGVSSETIFVLDYPLYFTPNGDGNNDSWQISGIGSSAKIYIFDRYGKLLKQISPTGDGWDGTFNGNRMPSSDYWFRVEYIEPSSNEPKEFKAHFTLKR